MVYIYTIEGRHSQSVLVLARLSPIPYCLQFPTPTLHKNLCVPSTIMRRPSTFYFKKWQTNKYRILADGEQWRSVPTQFANWEIQKFGQHYENNPHVMPYTHSHRVLVTFAHYFATSSCNSTCKIKKYKILAGAQIDNEFQFHSSVKWLTLNFHVYKFTHGDEICPSSSQWRMAHTRFACHVMYTFTQGKIQFWPASISQWQTAHTSLTCTHSSRTFIHGEIKFWPAACNCERLHLILHIILPRQAVILLAK